MTHGDVEDDGPEWDPGKPARLMRQLYPDEHTPTRPEWTCVRCSDAWPCTTARFRLLHTYGRMVPELSQYMAGHYYDAVNELPDVPADQLHYRIVGWVRRSQPIRDALCMGCQPSILPVPHDCGGADIPSEEVRWRCVCPEPECERRQGRAPAFRQPAASQRRPSTGGRRARTGSRA